MRASAVLLWFALAAASCQAQPSAENSPLRLTTTIPLDSAEGRIDHMAFDGQTLRLYVAALGNNTLEIIDLKTKKKSATLDGLKKPQGIAVISGSGDFLVASGVDGKCRKFSAAHRLLGTIDGLDDADNVRFARDTGLVYVGYGNGALAVVSAETFDKLADIRLAGHPESFQLETRGKRIFVNVPEAGHIAVIDRERQIVTNTWPVKAAGANFPMALDEANHRLLVGCRKPARLVVLDTDSGREIASLPCTGDTDDVFYDGRLRRVYVSGGQGSVSVFQQADADRYTLLATVPTAPGARTSLFVPACNRLYVAVPHRGKQQAEIWEYETQSMRESTRCRARRPAI